MQADEEMALYLETCLEEKDLNRLLLCESTGMPMLRCDDRAAVTAGQVSSCGSRSQAGTCQPCSKKTQATKNPH